MSPPIPILVSAPAASHAGRILAGAKAMLLGGIVALVRWQCTARERDQLAALCDGNGGDETLEDVGLSRADVMAELRKPRWRR